MRCRELVVLKLHRYYRRVRPNGYPVDQRDQIKQFKKHCTNLLGYNRVSARLLQRTAFRTTVASSHFQFSIYFIVSGVCPDEHRRNLRSTNGFKFLELEMTSCWLFFLMASLRSDAQFMAPIRWLTSLSQCSALFSVIRLL